MKSILSFTKDCKKVRKLSIISLLVLAGIIVLFVLPGVLTSASGLVQQTASATTTSVTPPVSGNVNWSYYGNSLSNTRFQNLNQINPSNVASLKVAWVFHTGIVNPTTSFEDSPIVINGIMYVTSPHDDLFAVNATTGKQIWAYHPESQMAPYHFFVKEGAVVANRGVAYGNGAVYLARLDDVIVALNAQTGKILWQNTIASYKAGHFITMAPQFADGMVFVGTSGGETMQSPPNHLFALNAETGKAQWIFSPVVNSTWAGNSWDHGGMAFWATPAVDPSLGLIYVNVGNPSPDFNGKPRAGTNLYSNCLVALKISSGQVAWYFQGVHHDLWDFDFTNAPVLFTAKGQPAVADIDKDGQYFIINRETGSPIFPVSEVPVPSTSPSWQNAWPTQPISSVQSLTPLTLPHTPAQKLKLVPEFTPPQPQRLVFQPATDGGKEWPSQAYSPLTGYVYYGTHSFPEEEISNSHDPYAFGSSSVQPVPGIPKSDYYGVFGATSTVTGKVVWNVTYNDPSNEVDAAPVVAGNLVFFGQDNGTFHAYNAQTGQELWSFNTPAMVPGAGGADGQAIAYVVNGVEYIAMPFGGNSGNAVVSNSPVGDALVVFSLP